MLADNKDVASTIVRTFMEQSDRLLQVIESASRENDLKQLISCFHKLAGSASSIGADQFGILCKSIELELEEQEDSGQLKEPCLDPDKYEAARYAYAALARELEAFLSS